MFKRIVIMAAATAIAAGGAAAQDTGRPSADGAEGTVQATRAGHPAILAGQRENQYASDHLIGARVTNMAGEEIGTVKALLVSRDGQVDGVIVALGGVMGIGSRNIGIAWGQTSVDSQGRLKLTSLSVAELEAAPEFERRKNGGLPDGGSGTIPERDGKPRSLMK